MQRPSSGHIKLGWSDACFPGGVSPNRNRNEGMVAHGRVSRAPVLTHRVRRTPLCPAIDQEGFSIDVIGQLGESPYLSNYRPSMTDKPKAHWGCPRLRCAMDWRSNRSDCHGPRDSWIGDGRIKMFLSAIQLQHRLASREGEHPACMEDSTRPNVVEASGGSVSKSSRSFQQPFSRRRGEPSGTLPVLQYGTDYCMSTITLKRYLSDLLMRTNALENRSAPDTHVPIPMPKLARTLRLALPPRLVHQTRQCSSDLQRAPCPRRTLYRGSKGCGGESKNGETGDSGLGVRSLVSGWPTERTAPLGAVMQFAG